MSNTEMQEAANARSNNSAMNCPVCMNIMDENIFLCKIGHSVCGTCKSSMKHICPQCRSPLTNDRNYQMEQLIKEMITLLELYESLGLVECAFNEYGCTEQMEVKSIREHEKQCQKRLIHCSFSNDGCTKFSTRETIQNHERTCQFRTVECVHGCEGDIPLTEVLNHDKSCENGKYPCRFLEEGCPDVLRFGELRDHEAECEYRRTHCVFSKIGCGNVGTVKEIEEHEDNCLFRTTSCSFLKNGCKEVVSLYKRAEHESTCKFNIKKCVFAKDGCSEAGKEEDIQQHASSCNFGSFPCIFNQKGCSIVLKLPEMRKHELVCEFRSTGCIFSPSGCTENLKISELKKHETKCRFLSRSHRINLMNFCETPLRCKECKRILNSEIFCPSSGFGNYCLQCSAKCYFKTYKNCSLESLIKEFGKNFILACMYKHNGCDQMLDLEDKNAHEIECQFRDVLCQMLSCTWSGRIDLLSTHTLEHNNLHDMILEDNKYHLQIVLNNNQSSDKTPIFFILKTDNELFSCTSKREKENMYWVVQLIGQTSVANKYTYKIKILSGNQELVGRQVCESDSQHLDNLIVKKKCVSFSLSRCDDLLINGKLYFKIQLKKI